jgi:tetratricopeptide (TPR) repeat protein
MAGPVADAQRLADQATVAQEQGDDERAELLLEQAVRANPDNSELHQALAAMRMQKGDADSAIEHLRLSVNADGDDPRAHFHLAEVLFHQGRYDESQEALEHALQLDANYAEALMLKGTLAERRGQSEAALSAYYQLLAESPDNVEARLRIAGIHLRSDKPENAAHVLRSICQCSEASHQQKCDAQWQLGLAYARQERWPEAAEALAASIERRERTTADEWYELAQARFRTGDVARARQAADRALEIEPGHSSATVLAQHLAPQSPATGNSSPVRQAEHHADLNPTPFR